MKAVTDTACLIACLLIALVLRLVVILHEPEQLAIDRDAYLGIADSLLQGRGYSSPNSTTPTAYRPPIYPLALAIGFRLLPQLPVVAEINLLAGLLTVLLTVSLGQHLQLGRGRYLAALLVSIDPLLLQYSARPMTESLCTFLAALWLWSVIAGRPGRLFKPVEIDDLFLHGLLVGITFGLLVLCRPTFWPMAGIFGIWWLARYGRTGSNSAVPHLKGWMGLGAGSLIGAAMMVTPWLVRNWMVFGLPILTTTHGGYTLLLGNNAVFYDEVVRKPWGTVWPDDSFRKWEMDRVSSMDHDLGPAVTELEEDDWNSRQAKSYMLAHPQATLESACHRVRSLWNTRPQGDAANGVNPILLTITGWYYTIVLAAGGWGMILVWRRRDGVDWFPLYVVILSVQLVHLFYWTNTRMRAPLTPAIALFAAAAVSRRDTKQPELNKPTA